MLRPLTLLAALLTTGGASSTSAETVAPPAAIIRGHSIKHPVARLTVIVPSSATLVGSDRFDLYGVADAEIEVFAEAGKDNRLAKLYWIQFESYWPDKPKLTHDYTSDRREHHWGTTAWVNSGPSSTTEPPRPGSDTEHVRALLKRAGYIIPPEMMTVRMVQLLDDPKGTGHGRHELMFIYAEDLASTGKTLGELTNSKGDTNATWAPIGKTLDRRALSAFQVQRK